MASLISCLRHQYSANCKYCYLRGKRNNKDIYNFFKANVNSLKNNIETSGYSITVCMVNLESRSVVKQVFCFVLIMV